VYLVQVSTDSTIIVYCGDEEQGLDRCIEVSSVGIAHVGKMMSEQRAVFP
jgi:hypothetical protein